MRFRRIPELDDERMAVERLLHDAALDALAAAVNETNLAQALLPGGVHVLLDDRLAVPRREGVEGERVLDGTAVRHGAVWVARRTFFMPPRPEKSPPPAMPRAWQAATRSSRIWLV